MVSYVCTGAAVLIPFAVSYWGVYISFERSNPNFLASLLVSAMSEAPHIEERE